MANFNIPENLVFSEEVRQMEPTDRVHASVVNNIFVKLFHNNVYNKKKLQAHESNKRNPHETTPEQIGAATKDSLDIAYQNGNAYTDAKIAELINGAPNTMDTLKEISDVMATNKTVVDALEKSIGSKAPKAEFDSHAANKTLHITAAERTKWNTVDSALSNTSTNAIQNKVVKTAFDQQNIKNSSLDGSIAELNSNLTSANITKSIFTTLPGATKTIGLKATVNYNGYNYVNLNFGEANSAYNFGKVSIDTLKRSASNLYQINSGAGGGPGTSDGRGNILKIFLGDNNTVSLTLGQLDSYSATYGVFIDAWLSVF